MAENTTPAQCTDAEWDAAVSVGLPFETPGTNAFDAALHKYTQRMLLMPTDLLRQARDALLEADRDSTYALIERIDVFTGEPGEASEYCTQYHCAGDCGKLGHETNCSPKASS